MSNNPQKIKSDLEGALTVLSTGLTIQSVVLNTQAAQHSRQGLPYLLTNLPSDLSHGSSVDCFCLHPVRRCDRAFPDR